jgi:hypothetical protein
VSFFSSQTPFNIQLIFFTIEWTWKKYPLILSNGHFIELYSDVA